MPRERRQGEGQERQGVKGEQKSELLSRSRFLSPRGLFTTLLYTYANKYYYYGLHSIKTYQRIRSLSITKIDPILAQACGSSCYN